MIPIYWGALSKDISEYIKQSCVNGVQYVLLQIISSAGHTKRTDQTHTMLYNATLNNSLTRQCPGHA